MTAAPGIEVALTGRLGRQPEPRTTRAGNPMVILNLAVDEGDDAPATSGPTHEISRPCGPAGGE